MNKSRMIDPQTMILNADGFARRDWFVRMPADMTADDVKDPSLWRRVQCDRLKALRKHDRVYVVGFAEDYAFECVVTEANAQSAVLSLLKMITFAERTTPLFSDDTYRVLWNGAGYIVERIADGKRMGPVLGSEALAVRHLRTLYPVHVG